MQTPTIEEATEELKQIKGEIAAALFDNRNLIDSGADLLSSVSEYVYALANNESVEKIKDSYEQLKRDYNSLKKEFTGFLKNKRRCRLSSL